MIKREILLIFIVYLTLTLFMTYPAVTRLDSHYIGSGSDMWIFPWNDWWLRKCLLEGNNPFYTTWMFYPEGVSLVYHNFSWLNTLVRLPLSAILGSISAYNLVFILNLTLGGVAMYVLARYLTEDKKAAFLAGLIFAFWPFRLAHFNRPNTITTQWAPLGLLFVIRTIREGREWRDGLLAGLFLGLAGLTRWLQLALAGVVTALYLACSLLLERERWTAKTFAALALAGFVTALLVAPVGAPLLLAQVRGGSGEVTDASLAWSRKGTDLVGYFVPARGHPVFDVWLEGLWFRMSQESFIGYIALALALYGAVRMRRKAIPWLVMAGLLFTFSLGADLRVAGRISGVPMPYRLVRSTLFASLLREPRRLSLVLGLPIAILAAWGGEGLLGRLDQFGKQWLRWIAVLLIAVLILFEYLLSPFPTIRPQVSSFYDQLARQQEQFALLELPMGNTTPAKFYMYYTTVHGKPLVEGHVSRMSPQVYHFIDSIPLTRSLHKDGEIPVTLNDISRQLQQLSDAGVRYVILHKDLAEGEQIAHWRDWLAVEPAYEDEQIVVFHTDLEYGRDFQFRREIGDGIGVIRGTFSAETLPREGVLDVEVVWGTRQVPEEEWEGVLALVGPEGEEAQAILFEPCAGWSTSEWGGGAVARGRATLQIDPFVPGGKYAVTVGLLDPVTGLWAEGGAVLGELEVQAIEREFEIPDVEIESEVVFGTALRLLGYDLEQSDDNLLLTLHWQALRRMEESYKFFVHLYDAETGELVAQRDVVPYGWTYPTHWWEAEEVVSDVVQFSLAEVVTGKYVLGVGVYEPEGGARLSIHDPAGGGDPGGFLALQEVSVP